VEQRKYNKEQRNKSWKQIILNTAVIVAEQETAYLLKSDVMKQRLLAAKGRKTGIEMEEACAKLGI
jgi:hypothetical protein